MVSWSGYGAHRSSASHQHDNVFLTSSLLFIRPFPEYIVKTQDHHESFLLLASPVPELLEVVPYLGVHEASERHPLGGALGWFFGSIRGRRKIGKTALIQQSMKILEGG